MNGQPMTTQLLPFKEVCDKGKIAKLIEVTPFITEITKDDIVNMLADANAILEGHFRLLSGKHSLNFLTFGRVARKNGSRKKIGKEIAARFKSYEIDAVVSPITSGALLGSIVANDLGIDILYIDVDKKTGRPIPYFVEGHDPGSIDSSKINSVLIVNDLTTTGAGLRTIVECVRKANVIVKGIGLFACRYEGSKEQLAQDIGDIEAKDIQSLINLGREAFKSYDPPCPYPDCPHAPIVSSEELNW